MGFINKFFNTNLLLFLVMVQKKRKLVTCKYCRYKWFSRGKRCPQCNNPLGRSPTNNRRYR